MKHSHRCAVGYFILALALADLLMSLSAVQSDRAFVAAMGGFATGWCLLCGLQMITDKT